MEAFTTASWAPQTDGTWRATILGPPGYNPNGLQGQQVRIDGHLYLVRRVVVLEGPLFALIVVSGIGATR